MNKSDAIDKENYIPGEPIFTGDIDIPGMTEENAPVLQFLDCLKNIEKCTEIEPEKCGKILTEFARENPVLLRIGQESGVIREHAGLYEAILFEWSQLLILFRCTDIMRAGDDNGN